LGPFECFTLLLLGVVVAVVLVLTRQPRRTAPPPRRPPEDPLAQIKRDYEALTARERRELLDFIQDDLAGPGPPGSNGPRPPVPPDGYTP
jgi:hypothetical protein